MKKIVCIPTYNEAPNAAKIISAVLVVDPENEVLIIDDNSPDGTGELVDRIVAENPRVHVLHRPGKQGIGPAYKEGFARALDLGADLIVQMDADFSHPVDALEKFYKHIENYDVVLGSRYIDGITVVNWPMGRLMLSYFKCWRREVLEAINLPGVRSNGYGFQIEMNYRAWRLGYRLHETPIIFADRREGTSKMNKKIAIEALVVVWWLKLADLMGRLEKPKLVRVDGPGSS